VEHLRGELHPRRLVRVVLGELEHGLENAAFAEYKVSGVRKTVEKRGMGSDKGGNRSKEWRRPEHDILWGLGRTHDNDLPREDIRVVDEASRNALNGVLLKITELLRKEQGGTGSHGHYNRK
jgi:hypothetical protein